MQAEEVRQVPAALLSGKLDVANALHKSGTIEYSEDGLVEIPIVGLIDSGAQVDMATESLVASIEEQGLSKRFLLDEPIPIGSVKDAVALYLTEAIWLPVRFNDLFFWHMFAIADIPVPPHLIMGLPWMQKYCPAVIEFLQQFGIQTLLPDLTAQLMAAPTRVSPIISPALEPARADSGYCSGNMTPIALNTSTGHTG